MQAQQKYLEPFKELFLFYNSASGGGLGQQIMDMKLTELNFDVPKSQYPRHQKDIVRVDIHLYNLRDPNTKRQGFERLRKYLQQKKGEPILVVCGGDGTVMWVVTEMSNFGINHLKVPISIIPLGTGNDFSQTLGWGKGNPDLLSDNFKKLKKRVTYWLSAQQENLDIWMVEAEVFDYGKFQKVENKENKTLQGKKFTKHFCNYFSVGVDGKIGYSFDMHRTGSRIGNLAVYGAMGLVKSFTKTKNIGELAVSFRNSSKTIEDNVQSTQSKELVKSIFEIGTNSLSAIEQNQNLLALNIDSFMGGIKGVWNNAKAPHHLKDQKFTQASHSDGKLDIVSFGGIWSLGFEKTSSGNGDKVYQGSGPFQLVFKQYPAEVKHRTYLQIDGQFIRYTHPSKLLIRKSTLSATSQIRVLRRVPLQVPRGCCA